MLSEIVLVNDSLWENVNGHLHVFKAIQWSSKVEVFDVEAQIFCIVCADDAVPQEFSGGEIHCSCCEFSRVVDEVSTGSEADMIGVRFLGAKVENDLHVLIHQPSSLTSVSNRIALPGSLHQFKWSLHSGPSRQLGHLSSVVPCIRAMTLLVVQEPIVCFAIQTPYMSGLAPKISLRVSHSMQLNCSFVHPNPPANLLAFCRPKKNRSAGVTSVICLLSPMMRAA